MKHEQLLGRVEDNFWERLEIFIGENGSRLGDVIFLKEIEYIFI